MFSKPVPQGNSNSVIDLFERIKDLLVDGRTDIVHNVARKPDLQPKLQTCFATLADLLIRKNEEIQETAMINRFYRACITKIKEKQPITEDSLRSEYSFVSESVLEMVLDLVLYVASLDNLAKNAEEESKCMQKEREEIEMRLLSQKSELEKLVEVMRKAHEDEKMAQEQEKKQLVETISQLRNKEDREIKQSRIMIEKKSQENSQWQNKFKQKQAQCASYIKQIQSLNQKLLSLQRQFNEKLDVSISQSHMSQEMSQRLKEKDQFIQALKSRTQGNEMSLKIASSSNLFTLSSIFFDARKSQYELPNTLLSTLENLKGEISSIEKLYTFAFQKKMNFHQFIDKRQNLLIVCSTVDDRILGAFTTAKFSLRQSLETKAYLFAMAKDRISINYLKHGRESIIYDVDFLIFGYEQLCIERGRDQLTSFYPHAPQSSRHYKSPLKEDYFLDIVGDKGAVKLKNYEIFQIHFKY